MFVTLLAAACIAQPPGPTPARADTRLYELRTYYAAPGKLDALHARFRNHTLKLFRRHGMTNVGYWVPVDNARNVLIYLLAFPNREARDRSFAEFGADPEWKRAAAESEKDGRLVERVTSVFMEAADFSPVIRPYTARRPRLFELRTYTANTGKLPNLLARFRDHTVGLFREHGMTNVGYWTPASPEQGRDDTLIYLLAHRDRAAADSSWKAFGADPEWNRVRQESEKDGPLLERSPTTVWLVPTDYSPTR